MHQKTLKPCPFCRAVPLHYNAGDYEINHKRDCFIADPIRNTKRICGKKATKQWNQRIEKGE